MQAQLFTPEQGLSPRCLIFPTLPLGQLRSVLPIKELAALLPSPPSNKGRRPWLNNEAKIALQFIKARDNCSDARLLERLNTDWSLQLFCGFLLKDNEQIKDKDLIWRTRCFVAQHLELEKFQQVLLASWKPYMEDTQTGLSDATCFESYIKFPTDTKLLWDCIEHLQGCIKQVCKQLKLKRPRNKYKEQQRKQVAFGKARRKTHNMKRKRKKALLYLVDKLWYQCYEVLSHGQQQGRQLDELLEQKDLERLHIIGKVYEQQRFMYENPGEYPPGRIVSLYKPYLHPIVRGKENKRVEFGAKLNTWQVSGVNFIEHLAFRAFHEGNRLKNGIAFHQKHFGKLKRAGADRIYATNPNRSFCTRFNIYTCFLPKGRPKADPDIRRQERQLRQLIAKARATVLEGSYGNVKNHYGLRKVKARTQQTEVAWIFFGMMTANAVKVAKLKANQTKAPPVPRAA